MLFWKYQYLNNLNYYMERHLSINILFYFQLELFYIDVIPGLYFFSARH